MIAIVKNENYEVIHFDEHSEFNGNLIFSEFTSLKEWQSYQYETILGVKLNYAKRRRLNNSGKNCLYKDIEISYRDTLLKSFNGTLVGGHSKLKTSLFFSIAEHFNYYNSLPIDELLLIAEKNQNETKTALEVEIEELKLQKLAIKEELETYLEIQQKRKEIKKLIKKLNKKCF
jgi:hypothetical protein